MTTRLTDRPDTHPEGECPERMSVAYVCLVAVVAVLAGVALAWIG
ncbi:hypothetical protein [Falsirhodobacter deserti]|nr:hypothetical protein [Falsirhodobacter deserti]